MHKNFFRIGIEKAYELGNRSPIRFENDRRISQNIIDSYWENGFYIFENLISKNELYNLISDLEETLSRAPVSEDSNLDKNGHPAIGNEFSIQTFSFAKPLSDPLGGTLKSYGRHEVKMDEPDPFLQSPKQVIWKIMGTMQIMESCLRLYAHPSLLLMSEAINGSDFTPFVESIWIKEPGLGVSTSWHQDGTTHWNNPNWDEGIHGCNFMTQLFKTTPENALWVIPKSHKLGKIDIKAKVKSNGNVWFKDAVPMLCKPGDVAIVNRQILHGSFANTSSDRRVTVVFGFHRRNAVLGIERLSNNGDKIVYDEELIFKKSRIIQLAIDARSQHFADEQSYVYTPMKGFNEKNKYNAENIKIVLKNYNVNSLYL